jgi:phosphotriesterase-related protein
MTRSVRTVLGEVDASELGVTYCHEHLIIDSPIVATQFPEIHLPSVEEAIAEASRCVEVGVGTMVDAMPVGGGGHLGHLRQVARATGLHIVAATGMHASRYYDDELPLEPDQLVERFFADINAGCGVIKLAWSQAEPEPRGLTLFEAAAATHQRTGIPILTHCEEGRGGVAQVSALVRLGVRPERITLSHTDKVTDAGYHAELLSSGVNLEYDQGLRDPDRTLAMAVTAVEAGFGAQVMLGTDGARRRLWQTLGGSPGLAWLLTDLVPRLESLVGREAVDSMLTANPHRWLAVTTA